MVSSSASRSPKSAPAASALSLLQGSQPYKLTCRDTTRTTPVRAMCLYFTQNRCSHMENPDHLAKFSHSYTSLPLEAAVSAVAQDYDYFVVLDLEGKVEILEFPVILVDAKSLRVIDHFHRFVRPCKMPEECIRAYISGKYGVWGLARVWHDTAISFVETLDHFEKWLQHHSLWDPAEGGKLRSAAIVTCGNWDIKTKIPQQCVTSQVALPDYFREWINIKDVYLNFYKRKATGMISMLNGLKMSLIGSHHLGLDDAENITRILQRMLGDGAKLSVTARRIENTIEFLLQNRV